MVKSEFDSRVKVKPISQEDYLKAEIVHAYYPGISTICCITDLYNKFGMAIIYDMLPRAEAIREKEMDIVRLVREKEMLEIADMARLSDEFLDNKCGNAGVPGEGEAWK